MEPDPQPPLILCADNWYDGPISGLALWKNDIVAFVQLNDYYEIPCAPGVCDPGEDDDANAWQPDDGYLYDGRHCFSRSFTLHKRDPRRIHHELVHYMGWARLMNPHHNALGTTYRPEPGVDSQVFRDWLKWYSEEQRTCIPLEEYEPDGPSLGNLYLNNFANARPRNTLPAHIQELLSHTEQEFDCSWDAWRLSNKNL